MSVSLDAYRIFAACAKTGSLTAAAKLLDISQPAVSQALKQMEMTLQTSLFYRSSKGVQLTNEGQLLYGYVQRALAEIEMGEVKLQQMMNLDFGEIRIGASDMTQEFFLLSYLEKFHAYYPNVQVHMNNAPTPKVLSLLEKHQIDIGFVSGPLSLKSGMKGIPVRPIQDTFVAGHAFESYRQCPLSAKEIERLPLICLEDHTSTRASFDRYMQAEGAVIQPEFELATSHMIVQFAIRNLGIGCVVKDFAQTYLDKGLLFELPLKRTMEQRQIMMVMHDEETLSTPAKKLLLLLREEGTE